MRRALAVLAVAAVVLTGCAEGDESPTAEDASAASSPAQSPTTDQTSPAPADTSATPDDGADDGSDDGADDGAIEIEIEGDRVEPNGMRVKVRAGETIRLEVDSDRPAELHVHSSPEQVLEIRPGESTLTLVIDRPGLVEVEEHDSGLVLLQLEVR